MFEPTAEGFREALMDAIESAQDEDAEHEDDPPDFKFYGFEEYERGEEPNKLLVNWRGGKFLISISRLA